MFHCYLQPDLNYKLRREDFTYSNAESVQSHVFFCQRFHYAKRAAFFKDNAFQRLHSGRTGTPRRRTSQHRWSAARARQSWQLGNDRHAVVVVLGLEDTCGSCAALETEHLDLLMQRGSEVHCTGRYRWAKDAWILNFQKLVHVATGGKRAKKG